MITFRGNDKVIIFFFFHSAEEILMKTGKVLNVQQWREGMEWGGVGWVCHSCVNELVEMENRWEDNDG